MANEDDREEYAEKSAAFDTINDTQAILFNIIICEKCGNVFDVNGKEKPCEHTLEKLKNWITK